MLTRKDGLHSLLSAEELARLGHMTLESRFAVDGTMNGSHKSRKKGISVEFADYRQYTAGDDIKHLDWKVFARKERLYLKQYEEETTLQVHLLVDTSASMNYKNTGSITKFMYACKCAAALAYITIKQHDDVGLALFNDEMPVNIPPAGGASHLKLLCNTLAEHTPSNKTNMGNTLHSLAEQATKRGLVYIFSDLFDDTENLKSALAHFRRRKHDVVVFQILDKSELEFPFSTVGTFQDLETQEQILTNPRDIRIAYQQALGDFIRDCQNICNSVNARHILALTDVASPIDLLANHLAK